MIAINSRSIFYPDFVANSILDITAQELQRAGISHLAFDVDETLVPKNVDIVNEAYVEHVKLLQRAGITVLLASNTYRDLTKMGELLNAKIVPASFSVAKPRRSYFYQVIKVAGTSKRRIAMVGDHILNDIIGANRAGLHTVLTNPYQRKPGPILRWYVKRIHTLAREGVPGKNA